MKNSIKILVLAAVTILVIGGCVFGQRIFRGNCCGVTDWFSNLYTHKVHFTIEDALGKENAFPVVIIGSGPAGLSAATYGGRNKYKTLVIEGSNPGGLLMQTSYIENMPGFKAILGRELIERMKDQATHFGAEFLDDIVESIDLSVWPYRIVTENGKVIHALTIIITTGATPKKLGIPGEQEYWGRGVTTCAICDAPFYKGKDVVVIGGGDSAVEEALQLAPTVKSVTLLVRKSEMRAAAANQELLKGYSNITVRYNVEPKKVVGNEHNVTGIELFDSKTNETILQPIDGIFLAIGHDPNSRLFEKQLKLDVGGYITMMDRSQKTSVPGVFAAGDVEDHRYRQAGVAAGRGIVAALDAGNFLNEIGFNEKIAAQLQSTQMAPVKVVPSLVKKVQSHEEFTSEMEQGNGPVFVDFYAPSCPSCMQMLPYFDEIAELFKDLATFISVDIEKVPETASKYVVTKIPCLLVFKEGKLAGRYSDAMTKRQIQEIAAEFTGQSSAEKQ